MEFKKLISCLFIWLVFVLSLHAQSKDNVILLKSVLEKIAQEHNVTFNYIEDEIAVFKIIPPKSSLSLNAKLDYISARTQLKFQYVSSKYISVLDSENLDKPLCGFVKDEVTNESIPNANVYIIGTTYSTITNEKGYFELNHKTPNDIEITHVNYEKVNLKSRDLYKENCPTIVLKTLVKNIEEVIAQTYLTKGISKKSDGTFEIKPKQFGLLPGLTEPDVFETLKQIPGISTTDETISNLNVRGGTHDQNLFLWNGIRLYQTGHFFGLISILNPNLTQNIKIIKNGSSPFYGESVSSVIDISTRNSKQKNTSSFGINMINVDLCTKIKPSKKSSLEISARRSYTDLIKTPVYKNYYNKIFQNTAVINLSNNNLLNYSNNEKFYFYDFTIQFQQKINSKISLTFDAIDVANLLDFSQSKLENKALVSRKSSIEQQTLGGNLDLKIDWNDKTKSEVNAYGSFYNIASTNESIQNNQILDQKNTIIDTGIKVKNIHKLNNNSTLNTGYQYNEIGVENYDSVNSPSFYRRKKEILRSHALIGELQTLISEKLKVSIGFRQNYIEKFNKFRLEPRLQINYAFNKLLQIEVLAEQKSQTSSQIVDLQKDFLGVEKKRWILSNNNDIPILKSNQTSIGLTFKKKNWLFSLDNFYKKINGITSMSQGFQNQLEFQKINGDFTTLGTEFFIQKQFHRLTTWLNYNYSINDYTFNTYLYNKFPNNYEIKHNVGLALIYDYNKLKLALGSKWFTGKPNTTPMSNVIVLNSNNSQEIVYNSPNSSNINDYFQTNFSGSYDFSITKKSKLILGFSVQNLLNSRSIVNQYYRINQNTNSIEQVNNYSLQRTINSFMRYNF